MHKALRWTIGAVGALALTAIALKTATGADVDAPDVKRGRKGNPAQTWAKAAELQRTLTAEQKAQLLARADSGMRGGHHMGGRGHGGPMMGGHMKGGKGLGPLERILTEDQKSSINAIRESYRAKFEALHAQKESGSLTHDQLRTQAEALHTQMKSEIDAKLTPEQKAQMEQFAPKGGDRGGMRGGRGNFRPDGMHGAADLDAMATALGLTADQKSTVGRIMEESRTEMKALMEKLRADGTDRAAAQTQMKALRDRHMAALDALLDDRQMEIVKIHQALSHRGGKGGCHGGKHRQAPTEQSQPNTQQAPTPRIN